MTTAAQQWSSHSLCSMVFCLIISRLSQLTLHYLSTLRPAGLVHVCQRSVWSNPPGMSWYCLGIALCSALQSVSQPRLQGHSNEQGDILFDYAVFGVWHLVSNNEQKKCPRCKLCHKAVTVKIRARPRCDARLVA